MPYIGNQSTNSYSSMVKQDLTGASGDSVTLSHPVANANEVELYINNVRQEPTTSYTTNGTTLSFVGYTVAASDDIYVIFSGKAIQTTVPPDGSVSTAKIASSAVDLTSKVTGVLPIANGGTGNAVGSTTTYVTNQSVSGSSTQTEFECNLTGTALSGGAKTLKIFLTGVSNESNGYLHFRIKSADGYTDGGYEAAFAFHTGNSPNSNGNTDSNQNNAMAIGYYGGTYNLVIDCFLVDPSTNRWVMDGRCMSKQGATPVHGNSIADNALGASKPITGFKFSSTNTNGLGVANIKYGYSYTV